jgi:multidrug efflux pump subunit AcrA (membrane-fusion protein)
MKQHIISLPHHPKRVIIISLIIAISAGIFGYIKINQKTTNLLDQSNSEAVTNQDANLSPNQNLTLGFLSGGRIKTVSVKVGENVKKGQVLAALDSENAQGALTQAEAAYNTAEANYQKIINGATGTTIDVAKAAVHTAQVNLDGITTQQSILVENAYKNLLNSTPEALPKGGNSDGLAPTISGNYILDKEGQIIISIYSTGSGPSFDVSGITTGSGLVTTMTPQPLGDSGLYIKFPSTNSINVTEWTVNIPNEKAANYLTNYNAYQTALENQNQTIRNAQASLDQANASLTALSTSARPEDIMIAQAQMNNAAGMVQIAKATLQNTIIVAPADGTVTSIAITPGQIAVPNAPAIQFISNSSSK